MAQKTYAKHSEYKTYSTKGTFDDKGFGNYNINEIYLFWNVHWSNDLILDSMKAELLPAKYGSLIQPSNGAPGKKGLLFS